MPRPFRWLLALAMLCPVPGFSALLGNNFEISGPGCRFPDAAYGSVNRQYLVVWPDYNVARVFGRFVSDAGAPLGSPFPISETPFGALYPAIAYNSVSNEFLVTWDDAGNRGGVIFGQRVRASDGALMGTNFPIGSLYGGIRSAVAWSPVSHVYLVTFWGPGAGAPEVYGQRVAANGALLGSNFNISNDAPFSGYPAVAWGAANQFLVTWDNEDGNIHGRRIDPTTGALLGSTILVTTGGAKDRSCIAYDSTSGRWLVQFNNGANAGFSYDQYGQLVNLDGSLSGGPIPLAHTPGFEGDTQFGGDVAFAPGARRFFSSFGTDSGMAGQESSANGAPVGPQVVIGSGFYTSLNNACDTQRNRFLTVWEGMVGNSFHVLGQLYGATLNPVTNFAASADDGRNTLSWQNPNDAHFTGTLIRVKTSGYPTGPDDGALVVDQAGTPAANQSFPHTGLDDWTTYYYAAFAHDVGPNYSLVAQAAATPRPAVQEIDSSEFAGGVVDGWIFMTWASGSLSPGTVALDAAAGNVVSTGSGASNNRDACTREGSTMMRRISTAGWTSIQVEYDVMAALHAPPAGSAVGNCALLEATLEDKLVVSYSTSGPNGPWITAQILSEGTDLPTGWTRKLLNLAGVTGVSDNPNFALRIQWQFNHANDLGRIDNVRVLSGAVTAPTPAIGLDTTAIEHTVLAGQILPNDTVQVSNTGEGVLYFAVSDDAPWLNAFFPSPGVSASVGPPRPVTISYNTTALGVGDYEAVIQFASTNAINAPEFLTVRLHVIPPACFWEPFDYYDGPLTLMGGAIWSGSATNQLLVEETALTMVGGGGVVSASHAVNCSGSNGLIAAQIKIKRGTGSGDFFWNIAFDDLAGNNLARWYGGSTIARGRVGNSITADMMLTGIDTWDDLYVRINTVANTSEFFFNGISFCPIPHGTTPANTIGSVRLERLDRSSANGDVIRFEGLSIGAPAAIPPRLQVTRTGDTLVLSWPATGAGFQLQSRSTFDPPVPWSPVSGLLELTNSSRVYRTSAAAGNGFYRLQGQ